MITGAQGVRGQPGCCESHLSYRINSREATGPHKQTSGLDPCTLESGGHRVGYSKHLRKADCSVSVSSVVLASE